MRGQEFTVEEREVVSRELAAGQTGRGIARVLGRHHSVVNREIKRNGGAAGYRAVPAQRRAEVHRTRPKPHRLMASLMTDRRLHDEVNAGLGKKWSPRQISRRLREDFAADDTMRVSHETIYQCLYLQAKGQLRTELALALRQGRTHRVPRTRPAVARGTIPRMVPISDRPAEADDRAVPGFWEGDLIIGKGGRSQIATLVERATRFVMLVRVPYDRTAERVAIQLSLKMQTLPDFMKKSVTWDQGKEMAAHEKFTVTTGMPVYFCDPHSPWQRGSNENTNGLLRQYFPKGTDLSGYSQADLDAVAAELNDRPRQTLNWRKPVEVFNDLLVNAMAH
jgi:transposase, IS30 family